MKGLRRVVGICLFSLLTGHLQALDWPTYRHDYQRSGLTQESLEFPLTLTWTYQAKAPAPAWTDPPKADCAFESFEQQGQVAVALSGTRFSRDEARAFFAKIVTGEDNLDDAKAKLSEAKGAARTKLIDQGATLVDLFENGRGNQGETKWDAYNAVTEFIDHQKSRSAAWKAKQKQLGLGSSLDSVWFGSGEQKKERALRLLRAA